MMSRHVVSRHVGFRVSKLNFELCVVRKMVRVQAMKFVSKSNFWKIGARFVNI